MKSKAFTLIELLVVISIIGLLSTVAVVSLESSRSKARDGRRLADVRQLRAALEVYFTNHNSYPSTGGSYESILVGTGTLHVLETENLMAKLPVDPQSTGSPSAMTEYYYGSPGWWDTSWPYQIQFQLENRNPAAGNVHPTIPMWGPRYMYSVHP